jgi:hypothetical protein
MTTTLYFPVPKYNGNYKQGMAQFGWRSPNKRVHAACDLYAPLKSDVIAVDDGIIVESGEFYENTQAIAIRHERKRRADLMNPTKLLDRLLKEGKK